MLEFLTELGLVVTFVPLTTRVPHQPTTNHLQQLGVEAFYGNDFDPEKLLESRKDFYDIVIVSRPHNGNRFLSLARQWFPSAYIIYDAEALYCLREIKQAELEGRTLSETKKKAKLRQELEIMNDADLVITVSDAERDPFCRQGLLPMLPYGVIRTELHIPMTPFSARRDLLLRGGSTGGHPPNTDAVLHFVSEIFEDSPGAAPQHDLLLPVPNLPCAFKDLLHRMLKSPVL